MNNSQPNYLSGWAQFSLFGLSYTPLLIILIVKIIIAKTDYLHWGGFERAAFILCIEQFWAVILIGLILLLSWGGAIILFRNLKRTAKTNFHKVKINNITDKSVETVNYIATYIIPFVYDVQNNIDIIFMFFIFGVIYFIYVNSSLVVVNPVLAVQYGLYEIEYMENSRKRSVIVISSNKSLYEGDEINLYEIGRKLYFCPKLK